MPLKNHFIDTWSITARMCCALVFMCAASCGAFEPGDTNGDGETNGADIPSFIELIVNPQTPTADELDAADIGSPGDQCAADDLITVDDIPGFVGILMGSPCNFAPQITTGEIALLNNVFCDACPSARNSIQLEAVDPNLGDTENLIWSIATQPEFGTASFVDGSIGGQVTLCYKAEDVDEPVDQFVVTVSDGFGGADQITIDTNSALPPSLVIAPTFQPTDVLLTATPGYESYFWPHSGETNNIVTVDQNGFYSVDVTDDNGCSVTCITQIALNAPVTAYYRVNAGGPNYVDPNGDLWMSDMGFYNTGKKENVHASTQIANTDIDTIYQTGRWDSASGSEMVYSFPVTNGDYTVRLHFAEIYWTQPNRRVFGVAVEGTNVISGLDLVAEVGAFTAEIREFETTVSDGVLNVKFLHDFENPKVSAIEILSDTPVQPTPATIDVISPTEGQVISDSAVTVQWASTGDLSQVSHVHLQLDDQPIVMQMNLDGSYTFTDLAAGSHTLHVNLVDAIHQNLTNPEASAVINFTTDAEPPVPATVTILAPSEGASIDGDEVTVQWQSSGNLANANHVHLRLDNGGIIMRPTFSGSYTFSGVAAGAHTIEVNLVDANHQDLTNAEAFDAVSFITVDNTPDPPTINITSPTEGESINGNAITVQWQTTGDLTDANHVHLRLDNGGIIMRPDLTGSFTFTGVAPGPHTFEINIVDANHQNLPNVEAYDSVGFTSTGNPIEPPTLTLTSPFNGATITGDEIMVSWTSSGDLTDASHVHVQLDEENPQTLLPLNGMVALPLIPGTYTITVSLVDVGQAPLLNPEATKVVTVTLVPEPNGDDALYRINVGGPTFTDNIGNTWESDAGYYNIGNSSVVNSSTEIAGTDNDQLYRSCRWDSSSSPEMMFNFPVAAGSYTVRLHFAETYWTQPARRVMDVAIEGATVLTDYDIVAEVGPLTADVHESETTVTDGTLNIEFIHNFENPKVSGIEILGDAAPLPPTVNILAPTNGATLMGTSFVAQWQTSGDLSGVDHVHVQLDDEPAQMSLNLSGSLTFNSVAPGNHTLTVTLVDSGDGELTNPEATDSVSFTTEEVVTTPPTIAITNPTNNSTIVGDTINVSWASTGDLSTVNHVHIQLDDEAPTMNMNLNGSTTLGPLPPGTYTVTVFFADTSHQPIPGPEATDSVSVTLIEETGGNDEFVIYRLNAGGPNYTDGVGNLWSSDAGYYNSGGTYSSSAAIDNTDDDTLYQTERFIESSTQNLMFTLPVDPGTYRVRMHFAEIWSGAQNPGVRVFDVLVNGNLVLDNFDIAAAAGFRTATIQTYDLQVLDGDIVIELAKVAQNPKISAIEVVQLSAGQLALDPTFVSWGHVPLGEAGFVQTLTLTNDGSEPINVSSIAFQVNDGGGEEFTLSLPGLDLTGAAGDVIHPVDIDLAPGANLQGSLLFAPNTPIANNVDVEFRGNFPPQHVSLSGIGGEETGHPFLHVVIDVDPVTVDYDQNGSEPVTLLGRDSHTHELGHELEVFEWTQNGQLFASTMDTTHTFPVGEHTVRLTIYDDNVPPEQLALEETFRVVGPDAVPGAIVLYYSGNPQALIDNPPATANFGEVISTLYINDDNGTLGNTPYTGNVLARINAKVNVTQSGNYTFYSGGGSDSRLWVDGNLVSGPVNLTTGTHTLEARYAVNNIGDAPLALAWQLGGGAIVDIPSAALSHDQTGLQPIINTAPVEGIDAGGNLITLTGLGYFPADQVVVHWGAQDISGADLTIAPNRIDFISPPGNGIIDVTIETPNGVSNAKQFLYTNSGPVPTIFSLADAAVIAKPTALTWGSDGRLYVANVNGKIEAYTFDDNYNVTNTQVINTLTTVSNKGILGIATSPFDAPSTIKLYVSHGELFANGGACFEGFSPYSGQVSVLTGPNFDSVEPLITGLPVSNHDHSINGLAFDNFGNLLICSGGNTNAGVPACNIGDVPESPLSAAILKAEVWRSDFDGAVTYVNPATGNLNMDQVFGNLVDQLGGRDVSVWAPGLRNALNMVYTTNNRIYATDNGPNPGFGPASLSANTQSNNDASDGDELNLVEEDRYYGSPNRNRGRCDDRQNVYHNLNGGSIGDTFAQAMLELQPSTNGIVEYRANAFNGAMRGSLIVQKWNGYTTRVDLSADGRSVTNSEQLNVVMDSLNIVTGPGGALLGGNYNDNKVSVATPQNGTAGFNVFDVHPWRAPATGGHSFVIGGTGFGNLGNTTVDIGGVSATVTSVSNNRIRGIVPSVANIPNDLVDIVVTTGGSQRTLTSAFRYLATPGNGHAARAFIEIDPGSSLIGSSTYTQNSFKITNTDPAGRKIVRVTYDFSTALFPDIVFDPTGNAGDSAFKAFQVNTNPGVGLVGHEFRCPHDGGFDQLVIRFDDFVTGQLFAFSVDVDPTSINGSAPPGPNDSGSISGLELVGTTMTVVFDDGASWKRQLFREPGSVTGGIIDAIPTALPRPQINVLGLSTPTDTNNANQTVRVSGPAGASVRLLIVEGALYTGGVPGNGFDLDPFEANTAIKVTELTATVGGGGNVDIPVTLTRTDNTFGGLNYIVAAFENANGKTSDVSNTVVVELN